jgi:hypothetical protein
MLISLSNWGLSWPRTRTSRCAYGHLLLLRSLLLFLAATREVNAVRAISPFPLRFSGCNETFASIDAAWLGQEYSGAPVFPNLPNLPVAIQCPSGCLHQLDIAVYGSFPYHRSSSVCLAAIHAGLIRAEAGGGVFVSRFYRQDWSNSSSQTVFPFSSSQPSYSNGVQSRQVDSAWHDEPADRTQFSYVVKGRGQSITQRREAPFPARAGHVHLTYSYLIGEVNVTESWRRVVHLIVGGYNATHYLVTNAAMATRCLRGSRCQSTRSHRAVPCFSWSERRVAGSSRESLRRSG